MAEGANWEGFWVTQWEDSDPNIISKCIIVEPTSRAKLSGPKKVWPTFKATHKKKVFAHMDLNVSHTCIMCVYVKFTKSHSSNFFRKLPILLRTVGSSSLSLDSIIYVPSNYYVKPKPAQEVSGVWVTHVDKAEKSKRLEKGICKNEWILVFFFFLFSFFHHFPWSVINDGQSLPPEINFENCNLSNHIQILLEEFLGASQST